MNCDSMTLATGVLEHDEAYKEMMSLFEEKSYFRRMAEMFKGLRMPRDTREYKTARIELQRQAAPLLSVTVPIILIAVLALFSGKKEITEDVVEIQLMREIDVEPPPIVTPEPTPEDPVFDEIPTTDFNFTPDIAVDTPAPASADGPLNTQPQTYSTVLAHSSPVMLRGVLSATRNAGTRSVLIADFGGNAKTEAAVMRSLRWLKTQQNADGSWPNNKVAMTGLAVLTFLAHGESPGESTEFGETVQRGIEFLIAEQNRNGGALYTTSGNGYAHAIATYAMCEAYGLTQNPNVRASADKAVEVIINGQHPSGGWDYNWKQSDRDDTSVMGWAAQALKAAKMANFYHDPEALERASKLAVKGFKGNGLPEGGFGYTSPQKGGLTGVGVLCMQFHGAANDAYVKNSLKNVLFQWKPEWTGYTPKRAAAGEKPDAPADLPPGAVGGACPQYYCYYATQAVFQNGGKEWDEWNKRMWPSYTEAQFKVGKGESGATCACGQPCCKKLKEPYQDASGVFQETGHWINTDAHTDRPIMDTCLAALQMMVYYRYLPTFKQVTIPQGIVTVSTDTKDVSVESNL